MQAYEQFEFAWSEWAKVKNVVGCASGTAALHLALEALDLPQGSEVILPDYTMVACAIAVALARHEPVFADCTRDLLVDPQAVADGVTTKTRAIMAVHVYGRRCNMSRLATIARHHDLYLLEDLAEAHGVSPHPGTDAACWSFYKNKIVAGEEGGAVSFMCEQTAKRAKKLRCLGFTEEHDFLHIPRGHNYRLSNAHAQLILEGLANVDMEKRRQQERTLDAVCPPRMRMPARAAPWVYDFFLPGATPGKQNSLIRDLQSQGVAARHGFKPMSWQKQFWNCRRAGGTSVKDFASTIAYVPLDSDPATVGAALQRWLDAAG